MATEQFVVYEVKFRSDCSHLCSVVFHRTTRGMRRELAKKHRHPDPSKTNACCWQTGRVELTKQGWTIAEMHFSLETIDDETIAHECVHAALHRVRIMSYTKDDWNEEELAYNVGYLFAAVKDLHTKILNLKLK